MSKYIIEDVIDVTIKGDRTVSYNPITKEEVRINTFEKKDYISGKLNFETELGNMFKDIPCKIYRDGRIVGELDKKYRIEGICDLDNAIWI